MGIQYNTNNNKYRYTHPPSLSRKKYSQVITRENLRKLVAFGNTLKKKNNKINYAKVRYI